MLDPGQKLGDFGTLLLGGDLACVGRLLQICNAIGIVNDIEDDIGDIGNCHRQGGGQLGQKRTERGNDALISGSVPVLVVFDRVHDGDHHDQIKAVLTEIRKHIAERQKDELQVPAMHRQAREKHDHIADPGDQHQDAHQLLPRQMA